VKYGADNVLSAVYRYGAPPTIRALDALLKTEKQQRGWQSYIADVNCLLYRSWVKKSKLPLYSEMIKGSNNKVDSRSGQEIVNELIAKCRKRKAARGGGKK
jgi:cell division inhibitor SulA